MRLTRHASIVILSFFSLLKMSTRETSRQNHVLREALLMVLLPGRGEGRFLVSFERFVSALSLGRSNFN